MKRIRSLINGLLAPTIVLAMACSLAAQSATEGSARVIRVSGPARFTTGNNIWQPLKPGDVLKPGTIVQTGKDKDCFIDLVLNESAGAASMPQPTSYNPSVASSASMSSAVMSTYHPSASQNVVRLWQNSALGIDKLTTQQTGSDQVTDTQLDLRAGRITGQVKKMSAASRYEIKLPNGVAGIRGTAYNISADGVVIVYDGSVVVAIVTTDAQGNQHTDTQVVNGGYKYDAHTGKVTELLPNEKPELATIIPNYVVSGQATYISLDQTVYFQGSTTQGSP
jgi:hypothetical protein